MLRRPILRGLCAIVVVAVLCGVAIVATTTTRPLSSPSDPNESSEVAGPVHWVLLGVGRDGRSVVVLPSGESGGCNYSWATAKLPNPTIQIRASIRRRNCAIETMDSQEAEPVTVPIPGLGFVLAGHPIDGPLYDGVAPARELRWASQSPLSGRFSVPAVEGLQLDVARQILRRLGARVEVAGPTGDRAWVRTQWPAPGTPLATSARSAGPIGPTLLLTHAPKGDRLPGDRSLTCAQASEYLSAAERWNLRRTLPAACRPSTRPR